MDFTAIIRKGEKQFVALCPELDVVSQGHSVEKALKNLKEAIGLYLDEMGEVQAADYTDTIIARFEVKKHAKTAPSVG